MKKLLVHLSFALVCSLYAITSSFPALQAQTAPKPKQVLSALTRANDYWQKHNATGNAFWDNAAYHTGNIEAYRLTRQPAYLTYTLNWAETNLWQGARHTDKSQWKYARYSEKHDYVLFGDWQVCFQTYIDLYNMQPDSKRILRAKEVMDHQIHTPQNDYWWWADGLYMVMPVMTKMYLTTGNPLYLSKLHEYFSYSVSIMYDAETGLFYRDAKYVYPRHKTTGGKKDFWARGDGWVMAALAKVLGDLPEGHEHTPEYVDFFRKMAAAVKSCQHPDGYWTRSMLDADHAPGPETSGTAFFTYALLWGINHGLLDEAEYAPTALRAWHYLSNVALHKDGRVGYVQPIGEKAIPGQVVNAESTANFGVGAFLLASCEMYRYVTR